VLTTVTLLFIGMGPFFSLRYYQMGIPSLSYSVLIAMIVGLAVVVWVRRGGNASTGGVVVTGDLLILLVYSNWCSGGIGDPNFGWLYVIPVLAALLVNARVGWIFTGIVFVLALLFWSAPLYGIEIPDYVPAELDREQSLANRLSAIVAMGVMLAALAGQQKHARGLLERVNNELIYEMNQRTEMQARMVRSERAASMGSLAAGMAHEINNPLTYVLGNLELLQGYLSAEQPESTNVSRQESQLMISEAIEGAYRVASLVRDLKTFSHSSEQETARVDLSRTIDRAAKMTSNEIRHRAQLEIDCPADVGVLGNQGRILQVMINLLTNAAHSIDPGASEANTIRVSVSEREGRTLLEVSDTGAGIDPDLIDRIFEPFVTSKAVGFGMGMGLSITRNILQAMGGTIEIKYSSPQGTAFVVNLEPFGADTANSELVKASSGSHVEGKGRLSVLIIDDEELVLRSLAASLAHHDVVAESDGRKAIRRVVEGDFDIVICDLMMPKMTGMDIHAELLRQSPDAAHRMLFMTGGVFVKEAEDFLSSVSGRWVEKPIDFGELETKIWNRIEAVPRGT
jgi:signal transduction histidine kinase